MGIFNLKNDPKWAIFLGIGLTKTTRSAAKGPGQDQNGLILTSFWSN